MSATNPLSWQVHQLQAKSGQQVPLNDLAELNKALRNARSGGLTKAEVGHPSQAQNDTNEFGALVPQSIQPTLDTASYTDDAIVLWRRVPKVNVTNTLHESTRTNEYGSMGLDPFISEGGVGPKSEAKYERIVVEIKYLAEHREISDPATMVGIVGTQGVSRSGLAQQTKDGTKALLGKLERMLYMADENLNPLMFNGLRKQVLEGTGGTQSQQYTDSSNRTDLRGQSLTPQKLIEIVYEAYAEPNYGLINIILVEPRTYGALVNAATPYGRYDQVSVGQNNQLIFGTQGLFIVGPRGMIQVVPSTLMNMPGDPITSKQGGAPPNGYDSGGSMAQSDITTSTSQNASESKFGKADAGQYRYRVVAVGDKGALGAVDHGPVTVNEDDVVDFTIKDSGVPRSGDDSVRYYRVYRTPKDSSDFSAAKFMWHFPANQNAGGTPVTDTTFTDKNDFLPRTSPAYLFQMTPDIMYFAQLLDFMRRPLAQTQTSVPFLLMLFGSPHVKVPTKNWVVDNAALEL